MTSQPARRLRVTPRAAALTIAVDPTLTASFHVSWKGAEPRVRERGDAVEVDYGPAARLRAAVSRRGSLTLSLNPHAAWAIELRGGVAGLRADLRHLRVSAFTIAGGARDLQVELPRPSYELPLRVEGGVSGAIVRRPDTVPVSVQIDGGARDLRVDETELGSAGGVVRQRTAGAVAGTGEVTLRVLGGASGLTVGAHDG